MVNHSKLYSLDDETLAYIESIPRNDKSKTVREALILHKFQHRVEKITENPQIKVKRIS